MDIESFKKPVFTQIFNAVNDGIVVEDAQSRIIFVNDCFCGMLGISQQEAVGKVSADYIYPEDRSLFQDKTRSRSSVASESYPIRLRGKDEVILDVLVSVQALTNGQHTYVGNLAVLTDISSLKQHQRQLAESEERFKTICHVIKEGVFIHDNGIMLDGNDRLFHMHGYRREDLIGQSIYPLLTEESARIARQRVENHQEGEFELQGVKKDGTVFPVYVSATQIIYRGRSVRIATVLDMTEFKQQQQALRESNEKFKTLCQVTSEGVLIHRNGIIIEVNDQYLRMMGYTREELIGMSAFELLTPESAEIARDKATKGLEESYELNAIKKDGTVFPVHLSSVNMTYLEKPVRIVTVIDLTENKKHQQENELFMSLLNHASDSIVVVDFETLKVLYANKVAYESRQLAHEDLLSKTISELTTVSPDQLQLLKEELPVIKHKQVYYSHIRADGSTYPVEATLTYIKLQGKPYVIGVARDVSDRRQYEQKLYESEQKYRTLVENSDQMIVLLDLDGTIKYMNAEGVRQMGLEMDRIADMKAWDLFPAKGKVIRERVFTVIESKCPDQEIMRVPNVDGMRWKLITRIPILDDAQNVHAVQVVIKDIDEIKRLEEENQNYFHQMTKAERLAGLGTLMGMMSHEINQPLTVIKLLLQEIWSRMQQDVVQPEEFQDYVKDCLDGVDHSIAILQSYRGMTRLNQPENLPILLSEIFEKLHNVFSKICESRNVRINLHESVYNREPVEIHCDIEQIVFILLANAIDASNGEQASEIIITSESQEHELVLKISDNGSGITSEDLGRIYEPFFSTKSRDKGTGLGLPIVKRILDNCGGRIECQSELGKGTTFTVFVPISHVE